MDNNWIQKNEKYLYLLNNEFFFDTNKDWTYRIGKEPYSDRILIVANEDSVWVTHWDKSDLIKYLKHNKLTPTKETLNRIQIAKRGPKLKRILKIKYII